MGAVLRQTKTGDQSTYTVFDVCQQAVNTVTADYSAALPCLGFAYVLGSNLGAAARTITEKHDVRAKQIIFAGLDAAGVNVTVGITSGSQTITSAAAFSTTQHEGAAITGTGVPADTYILKVDTTSSARISNAATATNAALGAVLFDRIVLSLFH